MALSCSCLLFRVLRLTRAAMDMCCVCLRARIASYALRSVCSAFCICGQHEPEATGAPVVTVTRACEVHSTASLPLQFNHTHTARTASLY